MSRERSAGAWSLWKRNLQVWAALTALLILSYEAPYWHLGVATTILGIAIAGAKALLVVLLFMQLVRPQPLVRLAVLAGLFWLAIMFTLTLADVIERLANR